MGLFGFFKSQFIEVIEWTDRTQIQWFTGFPFKTMKSKWVQN